MVWWKKISINGFGSNHQIRLGDLTGDGNKEIAFIQKDQTSMAVGAITVINLDGEVLWQYGEAETLNHVAGGQIPVQIHDLDGDGSREIIFISEGWIHLLEGRSGKLENRIRVPESMNVLNMQFADLLGIGRNNCMLLSDPFGKLVVLNEQLEMMWSQQTINSTYPTAHDLNGDGKQEVVMGYSVFDPTGKLLYDVGEYIGDRCNGVLVYTMIENELEIPCLVYAAGDWGLLYFDFMGNLIRQNNMGHVGYMSVADYNVEIPGLELAASNQWGSDGLIHLLDASGEVMNKFLPVSGPTRCQPVNWKGDGEEFLLTSADTIVGGMVDYSGQKAVKFPTDGHPVSYYLVQDLTGDARDEVVVWDQDRLWIYTQDDNPRMGNTYSPTRNPLFNHSMSHMTYSFSGW
jgi:hypothetical protein